jgi:uncharacterized membrane protein
MNTWFPYVRLLHIACGMIALFVAPAAMLTVKGGLAHRRWGKIYFWMMAAVALTAMAMALYRPIIFLALLAIFSFYFAFRGYRSILQKRGAKTIDWIAALLSFGGSLGLVVLGVHPAAGVPLPAPVVSITFGILGGIIAGSDMWRFLRPPADRNVWWYSHMAGMLASYIATVSAFSVVNFHFLPLVVRWLWPSLLGTPAIFIWIRYYKRRFRGHSNRAAAA